MAVHPLIAPGHRVLVVEDDPAAGEIFCELVASRGDSPRLATTVEEALTALVEEDFCYVIVDQQLPTTKNDRPLVSGGQRVMGFMRKRDDRRNASGCHVTPMIATSGYSGESDFVSGVFEDGADAFFGKPISSRQEILLTKIRAATARGGRGEHEQCAALGLTRPASGGVVARGAVRVEVPGERSGRRSIVLVDGASCALQDALFVGFLRMLVVHGQSPCGWATRSELGITRNKVLPSRIRTAFAPYVPEGFEMVEWNRDDCFRLNPAVFVEHVNWKRIELHPVPGVQKIVLGERERMRRLGIVI